MQHTLIAHGLYSEHLKPLSDGLLADPEAGAAFHRLAERAANEGFDLRAASTFRDYDRQAHIVNEKWLGHRAVGNDAGDILQREALSDSQWLEAILRFSALPGTSRHHWGTDMDIWDAAAVGDGYRLSLTAAEYGSGGVFEEVTQWLDARMAADDAEGFFKPYDQDRGGIAPEPWHISYRPVAEQYTTRVSLESLMPLWSGSPDARGNAHQPLAMLSVLAPIAASVLARYVNID